MDSKKYKNRGREEVYKTSFMNEGILLHLHVIDYGNQIQYFWKMTIIKGTCDKSQLVRSCLKSNPKYANEI